MVDVPNYALNGLKMKDNGDGTYSLYVLDSLSDAVKSEDAVHASGDKGIQALAVRKDTAAAVAADGDYIPVIVDASGRLWVNVGASAIIGAVGDAAWTTGDGSMIALLKAIHAKLAAIETNTAG